jgi:diketogulonate reductase-like aldo/keto reductase
MIKLSNGVELPSIGLGTFRATGESVQVAVKAAVQCGITHIDTAAIYKVRCRLAKEQLPTLPTAIDTWWG